MRTGALRSRVGILEWKRHAMRRRRSPRFFPVTYLVLVQVTTAEPVSYAKSRPCFERGMARDAVASATRDAGDIRCEVGIAPVFSWSPRIGESKTATPVQAQSNVTLRSALFRQTP